MGSASKGQPGEAARERPCLLLVEDDRSARAALGELLSSRYDLIAAVALAEGLERARSERPDLILIALSAPELGLRAQAELARDARTAGIPVIFLCADAGDLTVRCLELGAADCVTKPVHPRELVARIDRALRETATRRTLEALAQTDALTGLANFRALTGRAAHEYNRAVRYAHALSVVTIDLDHLKQINDRFGHETGNQAIVALSRHLRANLRESDFAARFGGDEFVVLLPYQTPSEARVFAERLRHSLRTVQLSTVGRGSSGLPLTISVGISGQWPGGRKESAEELVLASDEALYEAKRRGRDQVVVFETDMERPGEGHAHHHS